MALGVDFQEAAAVAGEVAAEAEDLEDSAEEVLAVAVLEDPGNWNDK